MHAPIIMPLLRRLAHELTYALFQFALVLAYVLHSTATLRSPFRAGEELNQPSTPRIQPRPRFWTRPIAG